MIKQQIITYLKVAGALVMALVLSFALTSHLFVDYSPQVRPRLVEYLKLKVTDTVASIKGMFGQYDETEYADKLDPTIEELQNRTVQQAPGIRATQYQNATYTEVDLETVELKEVEVTLKNGNTVKVKIPAHVNELPPLELLEQ